MVDGCCVLGLIHPILSQLILFTAIWQKYQFNNSLSVNFYDVCMAHVDSSCWLMKAGSQSEEVCAFFL